MDTQPHQHWMYRIAVQGRLDASWSRWFDGMIISVAPARRGPPITTLTGPVVDQPALRGILNKLWDLNLTVIALTRLDHETASEGDQQ